MEIIEGDSMAKDFVVFLSDQHRADAVSWENNEIRTPCLDRIREEGVAFNSAYTSSPLCVPARCSMLSSMLPSKTGIYTNGDCLKEDLPTFLHSLAISGYETVLCGRMHFVGYDQRHGFTKRIAPDITNIFWGANKAFKNELGQFASSFAEPGCLNLVGKGSSPIAEYDEMVVNTALEYLKKPHEKPQCIVIGTYAPHFPYVGENELFDFYYNTITDCEEKTIDYKPMNHKKQECSQEKLRKARASYYAMVTQMDSLIGKVYDAFQEYLDTNNREGIFAYLSDHGDMLGEKGMFAKKSFFDASSRIPMLFAGDGVQKGQVIDAPVSIMDLGPTLVDIANADKLDDIDGVSLKTSLFEGTNNYERIVLSEVADTTGDTLYIGRMARYKDMKLIKYNHDSQSLCFNLKNDKEEENNLSESLFDQSIKEKAFSDWNIDEIEKTFLINKKHHSILSKWGALFESEPVKERWHVPASYKEEIIE